MNAIQLIALQKIKDKVYEMVNSGIYRNYETVLIITVFEEIRRLPHTMSEEDINKLQRYHETEYPGIDGYYIEEDDDGEYVRYESLISLLTK